MTRYAHVLYCDDIRTEVGNKLSFVGIYQGTLVSSEIPALLAKLCVVLTLSTPKTRLFEQVTVVGSFNDQEAFRMELGKPDLEAIISQAPSPSPDTKGYQLVLLATLSPFQVEKPGKLTIDITADGETLDCGGLTITTPDLVQA